MSEAGDVWFEIPGQTITSLRLEDGERSELVALVFHEGLADLIASLLMATQPMPDGVVVVTRLETVHPDQLETWIREET